MERVEGKKGRMERCQEEDVGMKHMCAVEVEVRECVLGCQLDMEIRQNKHGGGTSGCYVALHPPDKAYKALWVSARVSLCL